MSSKPSAWLLLVLFAIPTALCPVTVSVQPDTAQLAAHLKGFRRYKLYELSADEFRSIQAEYLAWLDSRMKNGASPAIMNDELQAANLLSNGPENVDDMFDKNYVGFLGRIERVAIAGADDLLAVTFGIHTGGYCNFDQTVVLYDRNTRSRIARINGELSYTHGYRLRSMSAGNNDPDHGRLVASAWVASNCTSNWNGNVFRIDISGAQPVTNILAIGVAAFNGDNMKTSVEGQVVTFDFTAGMSDMDTLTRQGISRYLVQNGRAIRQGPIATSFGGFIDEWLKLDDADAARWATAEAAANHHELAKRLAKEATEWRNVADCPGSPPTREIAVQAGETEPITVFGISGSSVSEMRIMSVSDKISALCRAIDIRNDLSSIMAEPADSH